MPAAFTISGPAGGHCCSAEAHRCPLLRSSSAVAICGAMQRVGPPGSVHVRGGGRVGQQQGDSAPPTPCTTMPWLTVSGNSRACTTSQGTPEASSCDAQNAGLAGVLQLTTDRLLEKSGDDCTCACCIMGAVCAGMGLWLISAPSAMPTPLTVGKVAEKAYSRGRRRLNSEGDTTASSQTSSCCAMVATAAAACRQSGSRWAGVRWSVTAAAVSWAG